MSESDSKAICPCPAAISPWRCHSTSAPKPASLIAASERMSVVVSTGGDVRPVSAVAVARVGRLRVEYEKLRRDAPAARVGHAGRLQVALRLLRDPPGIPRVAPARGRVHDIADQAEGRYLRHGVDRRGRRVGDQQQLAPVGMEAPDRRAVERHTLREQLLGQPAGGNGDVPHRARQVDQLQVDHVDAVLLGEGDHLRRRSIHFGHPGTLPGVGSPRSSGATARRRGARPRPRSSQWATPVRGGKAVRVVPQARAYGNYLAAMNEVVGR